MAGDVERLTTGTHVPVAWSPDGTRLPNPYLYGPERFSRWMDIMIECGRGRLAALGVNTN